MLQGCNGVIGCCTPYTFLQTLETSSILIILHHNAHGSDGVIPLKQVMNQAGLFLIRVIQRFKLLNGFVDIVSFYSRNTAVTIENIIAGVVQLKQQISASEVYAFLFNANPMPP